MATTAGRLQGYVYFWNVATERCIKKERLQEGERGSLTIRSISTIAGELLVAAPLSCSAWLVVRDVKYSEIKGHEGAVIGLSVSDAVGAQCGGEGEGGGDGGAGEASIIYSASLDNTIRAYDPYDMATLSIMREVCAIPLLASTHRTTSPV